MPEVNIGATVIGRYRIISRIGQGGFADVYLAERIGQKSRRALKILRRDALGMDERLYQECEERFQLEAQLGARINHPNVVRALDYGHDEAMQVLVMDYEPGGNLADLLSAQPILELNQALQVMADIARGLAALHAVDVVHRDLKPSNILFDAAQTAKISDLGLAQLPGGASMRSRMGSRSGGVWHPGTRAYMSPEQEGSTAYLKSSSDIFSLGVILFEMLTGRNVKNLRPGTRVSELRKDVPAWLDGLLTDMLADDPSVRPPDGAAVLQALQGAFWAPTEKQSKQKPATHPIVRKPSKFNSLLMIGLIMIFGLSLSGVFLFINNLLNTATSTPDPGFVSAVPQPADATDPVILYLVSSANSMLQPLDGMSKLSMVRETLQQHWSDWPKDAGSGAALRVFGSQYNAADTPKSCLDTQQLSVPIQAPIGFSTLLESIDARGLSPVTEALFAAVGDFQSGQKKSVVLITDSGDTCGGDPCNWAATQYRDAGLVMPIDVIDLGGGSGLECLSNLSGGRYFPVQNQNELSSVFTLHITR